MGAILLGLTSGGTWGVIGYWLARDTGVRDVAWIGLAVSPLIGVVITRIAMATRPRTILARLAVSWGDLFLAVFLFTLLVGMMSRPAAVHPSSRPSTAAIEIVAPDPCSDPSVAQSARCTAIRNSAFSEAIGVSLLFAFGPFALLFLPLSFANHCLVWAYCDQQAASA